MLKTEAPFNNNLNKSEYGGFAMDYQIISDSSCDLKQSLREKYDIEVVPFYISFDDKNYQKEVDEIAIDDVYRKMVVFQNSILKLHCHQYRIMWMLLLLM